jgi:hypothetical protein
MDLPYVLKLGEGPEHGHVNCSFYLPQNFHGGKILILSRRHADVFKITAKNVRFVHV